MAVAATVVGCGQSVRSGHGARSVANRPPGPHPTALAAAGKRSAARKKSGARTVRTSAGVPLHQTDGAICLDGGMMTVSPPYVMTSWFVQQSGKYEKVRYQALLDVWTASGWRLYKAGTVWGGAANQDGLYEFGTGLGSYRWVPLTARDPSGKSFSGLTPGYYRAVVKFIWPVADRSVAEWAGAHYYWSLGVSAQYCTFK